VPVSERILVATILASGAASVFLAVWAFHRFQREIQDATRLDEARRGKITSPLMRMVIAFARPLATLVRYYSLRQEAHFEATGQRKALFAMKLRASRNLTAAGTPHGITADEYLGMVLLCLLGGLLVGVFAAVSTGWTLLLVAGLICGVLWPLTWLQAQAKKRKTAIFRALPFALDLLTLSVEAGLDFTSALGRILPKIRHTPLGEEFHELLRQIRMGQARSDALRETAQRVDLEEMTNVAGSLIQADELGASIGPVLRIQAEQMRVRREQIAEKKAMEAPVKILLPLILFIFPTVFLIILGPVALKYALQYGYLPWIP
jgi:tight adherence protein C